MDTYRRASDYDLFKLIVAILLLILFFLLLRKPGTPPFAVAPTIVPATLTRVSAPSLTPKANPVAVLATATFPLETSTSIPLASRTKTTGPSPTDSFPSPTATNLTSPTAIPLPSPTATDPEPHTATPLPTPTGTPAIESTATPTAEPPSLETACDAATSRSRLQTGRKATILRRLNFRSSPGIRDNWLRTNIPGTQLEVVGGPECVPHISGAYVWWQIQLPDGNIGWSAEGSIHGTFYFMEPVK